jgi:hypothetical protein
MTVLDGVDWTTCVVCNRPAPSADLLRFHDFVDRVDVYACADHVEDEIRGAVQRARHARRNLPDHSQGEPMNPRCVRCRAEIKVSEPRCQVGWIPPHVFEPTETSYLCFSCSGLLHPGDPVEPMTELVGEISAPNPRVAALSMALDLHTGQSPDAETVLGTARKFAAFVEDDGTRVEISTERGYSIESTVLALLRECEEVLARVGGATIGSRIEEGLSMQANDVLAAVRVIV